MKWPGGIIPYVYYNGYSEAQKGVLAQAIVRLQQVTCIKMVPRTTQANYVFIYPSGGCSSMVGHQVLEIINYRTLHRYFSSSLVKYSTIGFATRGLYLKL